VIKLHEKEAGGKKGGEGGDNLGGGDKMIS